MSEEGVVGDPLLTTSGDSASQQAPDFVDIDLKVLERVAYALAHNRLTFIKSLRLRPKTSSFGPFEVTVSARWAVSETPPVKTFSTVVDISGQSETWIPVDVRACRLDDIALADLTEDAPAYITVEVRDRHTGQWQYSEHELTVMSRNQWIAQRPEITAAFVQPNHPSAPEILRAASERLAASTGSDAIDGYQSLASGSNKRPREIAKAVFEALGDRIEHYINPPSGFNEEGQKLRPLDQVLSDKHGTCLDLACAYASVLEQAGLHPLIFIVHGHAFTGVWTKPLMMPRASTEAFESIINRFETGDILPVETVLISDPNSFDEAVSAARRHFTERSVGCEHCAHLAASGASADDKPHMLAAIDIRTSRKENILPLPARVIQGDQVVIVIDKGVDETPVVERRDITTGELLPSSVPARVQQWKNALLDLSFRNRLLKFNPAGAGLGILTAPSLVPEIEDLINEGGSIDVLSLDSISEVRRDAFSDHLEARFGVRDISRAVRNHGIREVQNVLADDLAPLWSESKGVFAFTDRGAVPTRARTLIRDARVEEQDSGVNNLHLTFGMLKWSVPTSDVGEVTSPIFLVPVKMVLRRGALVPQIRLDDGASTSLNYCLIEALRSRANLELDWFKRDIRDSSGLDVAQGLNQLREEIADRGLDVRSGFEVLNTLSIGLLRFNKIRLWKDLDEHWEKFAESPVVHHFLHRVGEPFSEPNPEQTDAAPLDDATLLNPQPADGAQSQAIQSAVTGQTFVLEGPPGTGKSQTITNLLANALARGLKVLFVAEKQAALDVVRDRLDEVGLMPFCLDLHDKGSTTRQVREQLLTALDFSPENYSAQWDREAMEFAAIAERLSKYRTDLHQTRVAGLSYYEAYRSLVELGNGDVLPLRRDVTNVSPEQVDEWRRILSSIDTYTEAAQPREGHPWAMSCVTDFAAVARDELAQSISDVLARHQRLDDTSSPLRPVVRAVTEQLELSIAIDVAELLSEGVTLSTQLVQTASRSAWRDTITVALSALEQRVAELETAHGTITRDRWNVDTQAMSRAVDAAAGSFPIGRKKRIAQALGPFADSAALSTLTPKALPDAVRQLGDVLTAAREAAEIAQREGGELRLLGDTPFERSTIEGAQQLTHKVSEIANRVVAGGMFAEQVASVLSTGLMFPESLLDDLRTLRNDLDRIGNILSATPESWSRWTNGDSLFEAIERSTSAWRSAIEDRNFVTLIRWVSLTSALEPLNVSALTEARLALLNGQVAGHGAAAAFDRGLAHQVLTVAGEQAQFDIFDFHDQDRRVQQFMTSASARQNLLRHVIPQMLHARRSFDSGAQAGRIGKFRTDLRSNARRRGSQSIREMVERYPDLISELTPCFLMSPDSVAKFVPPGSIHFDLVVFDEASQITVADSVGALGRADSAVIVGDSRQMPPTSVAQAVAGGGDEDEVIPVKEENDQEFDPVPDDAESILEECVASGVPQEMLSWHYRSRDEVLISFSNQHYYEGRLASFPAPSLSQPDCGIRYHRVQGQFDHGKSRTNEIEADAIVAEVVRRLSDPEMSEQSIGIVTLNIQQRKLITQKLLDTQHPKVLDLIETDDDERELFVLNLESVQGRERDVIILGTSFSKRSDGTPMPLNFGPLTMARGERRLNVAVTRARRQMVIFSSFDPEELARASSTGLVHLRNYLELARQAASAPAELERTATNHADDPYLDEIAQELEQRGHTVRRGYGLSSFKVDVAVAHPDNDTQFLLGILADGKGWGARDLVLDRDALPVNVLKNLMSWPAVARIWLPSWRSQRDEILTRIDALLEDLRNGRPPSTPLPPPSTAVVADPRPTTDEPATASTPRDQADGTPSIGVPKVHVGATLARTFTEWTPRTLGEVEELEKRGASARSALNEIVAAEGPIEVDTLLKKLAGAFQLSRVRESRLQELRPLIAADQVEATPFGSFVYPPDLIRNGTVSPDFTWYRLPEGSRRDITSIPLSEFTNLCRDLARRSGGISQEELAREALAMLGYNRVTEAAAAESLARVNHLIEFGFLQQHGGHVTG